jgi:hypothetical protein
MLFSRPSQKPDQVLSARSHVAPAPASPEPVTAAWRAPTGDEGRPARLRPRQEACPNAVQVRLPLHSVPARHAFLLASSRSRAAVGPPPARAAVATSSAMACCWPAPPWHAAVVALARIRSRARIATAPLSRSPACAASHRCCCNPLAQVNAAAGAHAVVLYATRLALPLQRQGTPLRG